MSTPNFSMEALYAFEKERRKQISLPLMWIDICEGDHVVALVLSQIVYWFGPSKKDGECRCKGEWDGKPCLIRKRSSWWDECRVTPRQIDRALKWLKQRGFVDFETHKSNFYNGETALHIFIKNDAIEVAVSAYFFVTNQEVPESPNGEVQNHQTVIPESPNGESYKNHQTVTPTLDTMTTQELLINTALDEQKTQTASPLRHKKPKIAFNFELDVFEGITGEYKKLWLEANPGINISAEIASAVVWIRANPQRRKRNWEKFLGNWMKTAGDKAQNRAIRQAQYGNSNATAKQDIEAKRLARYRENNGEFGSTNTFDFSKDD